VDVIEDIFFAFERRIVKAAGDMALYGGSGRGRCGFVVGKKADCCLDQCRLFHQKASPPVVCPVGK
jgi:hypothetical protein